MCTLLLACLTGTVPAAAQEVAPPKKSATDEGPSRSNGAAISLETLVRHVNYNIPKDILTESDVLDLIETRGVDFDSSEENLSRLRNAGASERVLNLVRKKAKPAPALKPPPPPTGMLALTCAPAECTVKLDNIDRQTVDGKLVIPGLPPGKVVLDFSKPGYVSHPETPSVEAGAETKVDVILALTPERRAEFGKKLLAAMLGELGSEKDLTASGSATLVDEAGKFADWNIELITRADRLRKTRIQAAGPAGMLVIHCTGERCEVEPGGLLGKKRLKGDQAQSVQMHLTHLRKYQLANLIDEWKELSPSASTADPAGSGEQHLRLETADHWYELTLGPDLLPTEVQYGSTSGILSGLKVTYDGYQKAGKSRYPYRISITVPDSKQAIAVKFDNVAPKALIADKDFPK